MVKFSEPTTENPAQPWYHTDLRDLTRRRWRDLGQLWVLTVFLLTATLASLGILLVGYHWFLENPEIAAVLILYVGGPLLLLWVAVRIVRHAWYGGRGPERHE